MTNRQAGVLDGLSVPRTLIQLRSAVSSAGRARAAQVVVQARKPDFWAHAMPLYEVVTPDGLMRPAMDAQRGGLYCGGSATMVCETLTLARVTPALGTAVTPGRRTPCAASRAAGLVSSLTASLSTV